MSIDKHGVNRDLDKKHWCLSFNAEFYGRRDTQSWGLCISLHRQPLLHGQWRNRRGAGGGQSAPPETSDREIFADVSGKKRQGKKGKGWKLSRKGGKLEMEAGKRQKKRWGPFFFFFFFLLFTFENDENLFWVYQNGNFLPGKSISRREKNQEKWLCPLRKICLLRPCIWLYIGVWPHSLK